MAGLITALDDLATISEVGGKGINLARLTRAGFRVPDGRIIGTDAYRRFVGAGLQDRVVDRVAGLEATDLDGLEVASDEIRGWFTATQLPAELRQAILDGCAPLFTARLAVRSSATTEDLPDLSFAGQQDTVLGVDGADALLDAVVVCWSSLWTARAVGYRIRAGIDHAEAALAVVVQRLIDATASGVMFTADPVTGQRDRTVIDATFGLGDALVSGQVEPDHLEIDRTAGRVIVRTVGRKAVATRLVSGGVATLPNDHDAAAAALTDLEVAELVRVGDSVQAEYGTPQDIEWAIADGEVWLLQTRAITSLFPIPQQSDDRLAVWFSFGAFQGVTGPITPLGRSAIRTMAAGAARVVGKEVTESQVWYVGSAGERLWLRLDPAVRHPIGRRVVRGAFGIADPGSLGVLEELLTEPDLAPGPLRPRTLRGVARFALVVGPRVARTLAAPSRARDRFDRAVERTLAGAHANLAMAGSTTASTADRLRGTLGAVRAALSRLMPELLGQFAPVIMPAMLSLARIRRLAAGAPHAERMVPEVLRGLPGNVTTQMDLALWHAAQTIAADTEARTAFEALSAQELTDAWAARRLPQVGQAALDAFLDRYGMRGVAEIDIGRPRWRENPTDLVQTLRGYLAIEPRRAPDAVHQQSVGTGEQAVEQLAAAARRHARQVRFFATRARILMGARETPKFTIVRGLDEVRRAVLGCGDLLADAGLLEQADDVVFLELQEIEGAAALLDAPEPATVAALRRLVAQRRRAERVEQRRRQLPRVLLGDGRAYYNRAAAGGAAGVQGVGVSPGVAEGSARVVLDPRRSELRPGEILVCPGTDPAWTPLFLAAAGLITEVGGMMTHGSVVAREYGIPAVVGVDAATSRYPTGTRIRIDGTLGTIIQVDVDPEPPSSDTASRPVTR